MKLPGPIFKTEKKVYFGDTDAAGVVYHGRYIYWMEAARIDFLDSIQCPYKSFQDEKIGFVPVDISIQYKSPLRFADIFEVSTQLISISSASFVIENTFTCQNRLVATAKVKLASVDEANWKPMRLPKRFLEAIEKTT